MGANWFYTTRPATGKAAGCCYCFPYAGGSVSTFAPLIRTLAADVEIRVASLPGRGPRMDEPHAGDFRHLALELANAFAGEPDRNFVMLGHSMGALLGFEVARELRRRGQREPDGMVITGARAPHRFAREKEKGLHALPTDDFIAHLRRLQGTPDEIFTDENFLKIVLPVLRADFKVCSTYCYTPEAPFAFPISVLGGYEDIEATREELMAWGTHTRADFFCDMFDGGHFFINDHWPLISALVRQPLNPAAPVWPAPGNGQKTEC